MPATLQATITARIDRLAPAAKRTLSATAVIGPRFSRGLLETLGIDPALEDLVGGEPIDQITFTREPEYVFHHPLIRTVAYEAQLKSGRAELHRRVAAAIDSRDPESADQNAALIAQHLEAAGDGHASYDWHMCAAAWATNRDIAAARLSWERAQTIADTLPADDPDRAAMHIAPRTMLCGIASRVHVNVAGDRFEELRQLCTAAGDKASLAIAMAGLVIDHAHQGRVREAAARYFLGRPGWREDVHRAVAMARGADPLSYAGVVCYVYFPGIPSGVLRPDDSAVREIEDALRMAERSCDDHALTLTRVTLGLALLHRPTDAERDRGQKLLAEVSDLFLRRGYFLGDLLPIVQLYSARERARCGDRDEAIPLMRAAVDRLFREGLLLGSGSAATGVLVETLLDGGTEDDVAEAEAAIERLAAAPADEGLAIREIWLLLRALLARAHGDAGAYAHFRDRDRDMATTLGFEGHIKWAEAMP